MTLKQYLKEKKIDSIQDYSELCEAEWNAIEEYHSSYGFTDDDIRELENRGYWEEHFVNEEWHEILITEKKKNFVQKNTMIKLKLVFLAADFVLNFSLINMALTM